MVAELTSVTGSGSRKSATGSGTSRPLWIQTATRPKVHNYMQASSDPAGLLNRQRGVVGLVGPYRVDNNVSMEDDDEAEASAGRMFVLKDEELVEEGQEEEAVEPVITSTPEMPGSVSPTPGRENWKLQGRLLDQRRAMSMTDIWPKAWGMYNEQHQEQDSLNEPSSGPEQPAGGAKGGGHHHHHHHHKPRTLLGILTAGRNANNLDMLDNAEPFCQLWILLSSLYGKLIVVLMLAFCITEVMDNSVKLLSLQGIFLMYLYVGSIAVIICIYIWVLIDSCASLSDRRSDPASTTVPTTGGEAELGNVSLARFGSLKRAHISRDRTSGTSFYLRVGALAFGLGTLVFNGLEMAMHSMMEGACLNDVVFVHPVLHGLFTFLQMHFLFVNSQVLVERFGLAARFGFMHLAATNLALWVRLIVWESGNEWTYFVHLAQGSGARSAISNNIPTPLQLRGFPRYMTTTRHQRDLTFSSNVTSYYAYRPISDTHISQVVSLHECLNTNSLGQLWTSSMPFLYPFIVQFSLIAAAVTFVMGQHVGRSRFFQKQKKLLASHGKASAANERSLVNTWGVDCGGASKGLFLGILCMVAGIVVIIIFLVVKEDTEFPPDTIFWLTSGALAAMLALCCVMTIVGLVQVRKLSISGREPTILDNLLTTVSSFGVQLYAVFGAVVGAAGLIESSHGRHAMLLAVSLLQLIQTTAQSTLMAEALRRSAITRHQMLTKPARQVVTFLLCSNAVLWAYDTFVTQSWLSQELQLRFFGVLAWGVVSRIGLPLLVFYRFHSCVLLLEVWKRSYRTPLLDPGN